MKPLSTLPLYYDGSSAAKAALTRCAELALRLPGFVHVVSVVDIDDADARCVGLLSGFAISRLEAVAQQSLDEAVEELRNMGIVTSGRIAFGPLLDVILTQIETVGADWVVVGDGSQSRLFWWIKRRSLNSQLVQRLRHSTIVTVTEE